MCIITSTSKGRVARARPRWLCALGLGALWLACAWPAAALTVVFGSGYQAAAATGQTPDIWAAMAARNPDIVVLAGDVPTAVPDPDALGAAYASLAARPSFGALRTQAPTYAVYGTHNFADPTLANAPLTRDTALALFRDFWDNPAYGLPETPGCFFRLREGPAEFFFLDTRYHRAVPRDPEEEAVLLGEAQMAWLQEGLRASTARYKVLVSAVPFGQRAWHMWGGVYHEPEREALFAFIDDQNIGGVFGLSGGSPRSERWDFRIGWGHRFHEFCTGPLAGPAIARDPERLPDGLEYHHAAPGVFGEVFFAAEPERNAPNITVRVVEAGTGVVHEHTYSASDLELPR